MTLLSSSAESLMAAIAERRARTGVIGLGYVGLPLAITIARNGFDVTGFDIDPAKITALDAHRSYIDAVPDAALKAESEAGRFRSTTDFSALASCDVIVICVPTPLTKQREPDMSYVVRTAEDVARTLRPGRRRYGWRG